MSELGRYHWPYFPREVDWHKPESGGMGFAYPELAHVGHVRAHRETEHLDEQRAKGEPAECLLSPIKAVPLRTVKLKNPSISVNGRKLVFPLELETGSYIEFKSRQDCVVL